MISITIASENCNTWQKKNHEDTAAYELECSSCSAYGSFSYLQKYFIWCWEISIPFDWEFCEWEKIKLYPTQVPIVLIKCDLCGEIHRLYPSFLLKGTTLTQAALLFITFIYESSALTWRAIPDKFCDGADKIAHSTLFKAVHGLGKSILRDNKIKEALAELVSRYQPCSPPAETTTWPADKSRYAHTLADEHLLRGILLPLLKTIHDTFTSHFFKYLHVLRILLSGLSPPVTRLYHS